MNFTAFTYVLLALIALVGVVEVWSGGEVGWWRYAAALLVLGLLYEWMQARSLRLAARIDGNGVLPLGRLTSVVLEFLNAGARAETLQFVADLPPSLQISRSTQRLDLAPQTVAVQELAVRPLALGEQRWTDLPGRVQGRLGLGWWPVLVGLDARLSVVPDGAGRRGRVLGEMNRGMQARKPGAGYELHHLREYVRGDPLHTIDWKATARARQPITRVFAEDQHLQIVLVLDVGRTSRTFIDGLSQFGHYVNVAARFAEHAVMQGDEVGMVVAADQVVSSRAPAGGAGAVSMLRGQLAGLQPRAVETDLPGAALHVQQMVKRRALIVLLTDLYGQSVGGSFGDAVRLWRHKHLLVAVGMIGEDVIGLTTQDAGSPQDAYVSLASRQYRDALTHNARAVQRLGAYAVVCRPAVLEERVFATYQQLKAQRRV